MALAATTHDAAILGAGAAGLFCAGLLAQQGLRVALIDHAPEPGRKILISGGGRANFTNLNTRPEHFLSENPHFAHSALARYSPEQFVALVERHGIRYHAKTPGQLFCDGSARQIVDMLLAECAGVELLLGTSILSVERRAEEDGWHFTLRLRTAGGEATLTTRNLIVATGGLSIPKLGATDFGYGLARQFGLAIVPTRPALVPFTFSPQDAARFDGLSGVATEATLRLTAQPIRANEKAPQALRSQGEGRQASAPGTSSLASLAAARSSRAASRRPRGQTVEFRDKLLITHRGLSGPAVLQISSYWQPGATLSIDLAPDRDVTAPLLRSPAGRDGSAALAAYADALPRRLAERLLSFAPPRGWSNDALLAAEQQLHAWPLTPSGTEGYPKAEVTAGGVSTAELHPQTLEARRVPGLYFIGEVIDVTGHLGGFNFQWAWASAAAAASAIGSKNKPGASPDVHTFKRPQPDG